MAITQAMCTSFKVALLDGEMDFVLLRRKLSEWRPQKNM
jgi:hypothetical protein